MEQLENIGTHEKKTSGDTYKETLEGLVRTDINGRISLYPNSLMFVRKSGKKYCEIGREVGPYPNYNTKVWIKSMDTGGVRIMQEQEFKVFKNG